MPHSPSDSLAEAVSAFGTAVKATLGNPTIAGEPEEQLRTPLVALVKAVAGLTGIAGPDTALIGETRLLDLMVRPDFAVIRKRALIGFIEVKAPGKGADPRKFKGARDKAQWEKLKALPNLIYTDGNAFSLWQAGTLARPILTLDGDVEVAGKSLTAPPALLDLFAAFFAWRPIPPRTPGQLAETTARLCRLLRDEVTEQLDRNAPGLTGLKEDWRRLLFPHASDAEFADGRCGVGRHPALEDLFVYNGSGVMPGRTWVIAPDAQSLKDRWRRLAEEKDPVKRAVLFHPHPVDNRPGDRHAGRIVEKPLTGHPHKPLAVKDDRGAGATPIRYAFRSFDRQWILPDARLINRPNPRLWDAHSDRQVHLTGLFAHSPSSGPAVTFSASIPDLHHYKGSFGERFAAGHPPGPPRVGSGEPTIPAEGVLPTTLDAMPHELDYDPVQRRLKIGTGYVANVAPAVWNYEISGKRVLTRLVTLEPAQDDLLARIVDGPTIDADMLRGTGALSDSSAEAVEPEPAAP